MTNLLLSLLVSITIPARLQAAEFNLQSLSLKDIRARALNGEATAPAVKSVIPVDYRVEDGPGAQIPEDPPNLTAAHWKRLTSFLKSLEENSPSLREAPATDAQVGRLRQGLRLIGRHYVDRIPAEKWDEILAAMSDTAETLAASGKGWDGIIDRMLAKGVSMLKDPHSMYLNPEQSKSLRNFEQGYSVGIGMRASLDKKGLRIDVIYPGSGAEIAKLREQDIITEWDGQPLGDISRNDRELLGKKLFFAQEGTYATLRIIRDGRKLPDPIQALQTRIKEPDVFKKMVAHGIGYLYIPRFLETTDQEVFNKIRQLRQEGASSLVIDLRGNPGGSLHSVSSIASEFLQHSQRIVSLKHQDLPAHKGITVGNGKFSNMHVAILIDEDSASASEILSGALQDHRRATVIGSRSFGKGSGQQWLDAGDGRILDITDNRWYTPNDRNISAQPDPETGKEIPGTGGIIPDVFVDVSEDQASQVMNQIHKEILGIPLTWRRTSDPVLKKALDILSGTDTR